jgi:hypothetical protein
MDLEFHMDQKLRHRSLFNEQDSDHPLVAYLSNLDPPSACARRGTKNLYPQRSVLHG